MKNIAAVLPLILQERETRSPSLLKTAEMAKRTLKATNIK